MGFPTLIGLRAQDAATNTSSIQANQILWVHRGHSIMTWINLPSNRHSTIELVITAPVRRLLRHAGYVKKRVKITIPHCASFVIASFVMGRFSSWVTALMPSQARR